MKLRLLILFLVVGVVAEAQPGYTTINSRYNWLGGRFRAGLHVPGYNGTPSGVTTGVWIGDGAVAVDTANHRFYIYSGGAWVRVANFSEIGGGIPALGTANQLLRVNAGATALEYFTPSYVSTRDRFGLSGEDVTATANRAFELAGFSFNINDAATGNYLRVVPSSGRFEYFASSGSGGTYKDGTIDITPDDVIISAGDAVYDRYYTLGTGSGGTIDGDGTGIYMAVTNLSDTISTMTVMVDKIQMKPDRGRILIDTLKVAVADTSLAKPTIWNSSTKMFEVYPYWPGGGSGFTNLTQFEDQTAWRIFYSDADGDVTELALGDAGEVLTSSGTTSAPSWELPEGGVSDHGGLTGLSDDDHTQYALLAGRTGGQTIVGGTDATDGLTFKATTGTTSGSGYAFEFTGGANGATSFGGFRDDGILRLNSDYIYFPSGSGSEIYQNSSQLFLQANGGPIIFRSGGTTAGRIDNALWNIGDGNVAHSNAQVAGSMARKVTTTATGITLSASHSNVIVTATGQTITLPALSGIEGREYIIKLTASGTCTIDGNASETIDGATTYSLSAQYKYVKIVAGASEWHIMGNN